MTDTRQLLDEYAAHNSEPAFQELVARYIDLVYSSARRLVDGDAHLAQDVVQIVFTDLARKARGLSPEIMLGGWLHQRTFHVATTLIRTERRRRDRERRAAEMYQHEDSGNFRQIAPLLDEAIVQLNADDRKAILLRFFEQREFRTVGEALGVNEDAARMRVNRALDKLHSLLQRRGVALSAAGLGTLLTSEAVTAAPVGLALTISSAALATTTAGSGIAFTFFKLATMTKLQTAIIGTLVLAGVATPLVVQHRASARLRDRDEALRVQADHTAQLEAENARLSSLLAPADGAPETPADISTELLRLRGEVARLRNETQDLAQQKAAAEEKTPAGRARRLKEKLEQMPDLKIPELQLLTDSAWETVGVTGPGPGPGSVSALKSENDFRMAFGLLRQMAKDKFGRLLNEAIHQYAAANQGQLPADLSLLKPFLTGPVDDAMLQRYQLKQTGKLSDVPELGPYHRLAGPGQPTIQRTESIVVEKAAVDDKYDTLFSIEANGYSSQSVGGQLGNGWGTYVRK